MRTCLYVSSCVILYHFQSMWNTKSHVILDDMTAERLGYGKRVRRVRRVCVCVFLCHQPHMIAYVASEYSFAIYLSVCYQRVITYLLWPSVCTRARAIVVWMCGLTSTYSIRIEAGLLARVSFANCIYFNENCDICSPFETLRLFRRSTCVRAWNAIEALRRRILKKKKNNKRKAYTCHINAQRITQASR